MSNFGQTPAINEHILQTSSHLQGGAAPETPVQWRGAMNDARGYRLNAAERPLAGKSCQPYCHSRLLSPLSMAYARLADEAIDALLVVR